MKTNHILLFVVGCIVTFVVVRDILRYHDLLSFIGAVPLVIGWLMIAALIRRDPDQ